MGDPTKPEATIVRSLIQYGSKGHARYVKRLMSDGTVRSRITHEFNGQKHDSGWVVEGPIRSGLTADQWAKDWEAFGYRPELVIVPMEDSQPI